jgi:hypothetical protein
VFFPDRERETGLPATERLFRGQRVLGEPLVAFGEPLCFCRLRGGDGCVDVGDCLVGG